MRKRALLVSVLSHEYFENPIFQRIFGLWRLYYSWVITQNICYCTVQTFCHKFPLLFFYYFLNDNRCDFRQGITRVVARLSMLFLKSSIQPSTGRPHLRNLINFKVRLLPCFGFLKQQWWRK